jgi:hypothetical protein
VPPMSVDRAPVGSKATLVTLRSRGSLVIADGGESKHVLHRIRDGSKFPTALTGSGATLSQKTVSDVHGCAELVDLASSTNSTGFGDRLSSLNGEKKVVRLIQRIPGDGLEDYFDCNEREVT